MRILVLGVGNILLRDEGMGVHALHLLTANYNLPARVTSMDGGVMGLDLLQHIESCTHLLVMDAIETGDIPGTFMRLEGDQIQTSLAHKLSIHQLGLQEVLATCKLAGWMPSQAVLVGMQPASLDWGVELTDVIAHRMGKLVTLAIQELERWGVTAHLKDGHVIEYDPRLLLPGLIGP